MGANMQKGFLVVLDNSKWSPPQNNCLVTSQPKSQNYNYKNEFYGFFSQKVIPNQMPTWQ